LIENDALPEEDLLLKLLNWDMPVVVPYIVDEVLKKPICAPGYKPGVGLQPLQWSVFTCVLIKTNVLNCFATSQPFMSVAIESGFFNKLRHYGHRGYQDTNTELKIARRPSYPVDYGGLETEWKAWVEIDKKRRLVPDRKPIDPKDKRQLNGIYMPEGLGVVKEGGTGEAKGKAKKKRANASGVRKASKGKTGTRGKGKRNSNRAV